jgi:Tannase and feruloyl esterase
MRSGSLARHRLAALTLACAASAALHAQTAGPVAAPPMPPSPPSAEQIQMCRALLNRSFGPARVLAATAIAPPYEAHYGSAAVPVQHPFCLVEGRIEPESGSEIGFEVWLPIPAAWNGRFLVVGSGGSMGDFHFTSLARGVNRGFATVSTDSGHRQQRGSDSTWAFQRPVRVLDFGHRARHLSTAAGKAVTRAFYGRAPRYSYFSGYSRGGAEGLMSAQRYPGDYDGILAGA